VPERQRQDEKTALANRQNVYFGARRQAVLAKLTALFAAHEIHIVAVVAAGCETSQHNLTC
jgi:hypothetical protein